MGGGHQKATPLTFVVRGASLVPFMMLSFSARMLPQKVGHLFVGGSKAPFGKLDLQVCPRMVCSDSLLRPQFFVYYNKLHSHERTLVQLDEPLF